MYNLYSIKNRKINYSIKTQMVIFMQTAHKAKIIK